MKIQNLWVEGLFGEHNYEVPLHESGITVIHAPNGLGKTTLLRLIDGALNGRFFELQKIQFEKLGFLFSDGSRLCVCKERKEPMKIGEQGLKNIYYEFLDAQGTPYEFKPEHKVSWNYPLGLVDDQLPFLERVGPELWEHRETGEYLDYKDVLKKYGNRLPMAAEYDWPDWLKKIRRQLPVHFISAHRLLKAPYELKSEIHGAERLVPAVRYFSEQLVKTFRAKLAASADINQALDRSFPSRLVTEASKEMHDSSWSQDYLENKLNDLAHQRARLAHVGLLDTADAGPPIGKVALDEFTCRVLNLYIEDMEKKLAVFYDLERRLNMFLALVNSKFQHKELVIDREKGFVIQKSNSGQFLPVDSLSSGEQHLLVLYYQLLFREEPNELVLIDEPELSLHIAWQGEFLDDLYQIHRLNGISVVLATHSPDIIDGEWELTVELEQKSNR
ncbi:AAA family ATPase [Heliophilum fasciatum]|uniref:Putative ATP-binding protein involved in virulence n=1 Tax=Heliophilum fasciatum TaxID=35700 RepID=A0A4R2RFR4_9FIRM|nr:AAA family ATPase [Heliophilum fasciatum]MCW2279011.1 putative ATP-binding protein involved in virulence [Heliophilum fasciatum]TCP61753.1 putative ATP-binding protein involved in virulence [Heliophilum fasciatum]